MKTCNVCKIEKNEDEFHKKGNKLQYMCKECRKGYIRDHYLKNKERYLEKAREGDIKAKKVFDELRSGLVCQQCGENHPATLDFHHINADSKEYTIAAMNGFGREKIIKEMQKCIVLCSNCHRKLHYNERNK